MSVPLKLIVGIALFAASFFAPGICEAFGLQLIIGGEDRAHQVVEKVLDMISCPMLVIGMLKLLGWRV